MHSPSILLFDGHCSLCNASVDFVVKRDRNKRFLLAAFQEPAGQKVLQQLGLPADYLDTLILVETGSHYTGSTAALRVAKKLGGSWPLLYPLLWLPKSIRDGLYSWVARHRYAWFGQTATCRIPTEEEKDRFLTVDHPFLAELNDHPVQGHTQG